jgi:hypothetical protein
VSGSHLARNLALLRARNPELADRVAATETGGIEPRACPNGMRTLAADGVLLGSERDPEAEAERVVSSLAERRPDLVLALGFGLGLEWARLRQRHPCPIVVFEPDPARLRAALDLDHSFSWLAEEDVSLVSTPRELCAWVDAHYVPGLRLEVSVRPSAQRLCPDAVRDGVRAISSAKDTVDVTFATRFELAADWTRQSADNAPHYLANPGFGTLGQHFAGRPAVVAAAGPSLDRQLPTLARMQDRVLTFAVGPSLGALRQAGIEPDFVHLLESTNVSHQLTRSGTTRELNLVLTPKAHHSLYEIEARSHFVAYTASDGIALWANELLGGDPIMSAAPSVAMQAVWIAAALGASPILLIGQDLAFTGGRVYASGSCYDAIEAEVGDDGCFSYTNMEARIDAYDGDAGKLAQVTTQRTVWVPGWDGEPVASCLAYASFRHGFAEIGAALKHSGIELVNCTEGGAHIDGIAHRPFAETLAALPRLPQDQQAHIDACYRGWRKPSLRELDGPIRRQRRLLERIQRHAGRAARCTEALRQSTERYPDLAANLARVQRLQARVSAGVTEVPWLELMLQAELQEALKLQRRAERAAPTPDEVLEEVALLLHATESGARRALDALERLERALRPRREHRESRAASLTQARMS